MTSKYQNISLSDLKRLAKMTSRKKGIPLHEAQNEVARQADFRDWFHAEKVLSKMASEADGSQESLRIATVAKFRVLPDCVQYPEPYDFYPEGDDYTSTAREYLYVVEIGEEFVAVDAVEEILAASRRLKEVGVVETPILRRTPLAKYPWQKTRMRLVAEAAG